MKKNLIVSMMLMGVLLSGCVNGKQYDVTEPSKYLISSEAGETKNTVSYTHLTLPTTMLV